MALTDIFSTSSLICLGITLLLVGFLFIYINQKMADQNHKISSMLGLISTMAEELNVCRARVNMLTNAINVNSSNNKNLGMMGGNSNLIGENLIDVSDEEDDEEDDEDEDDEDEDEDDEDEDDEDEDDDDEDYEDNDDEDKENAQVNNEDIEVLGEIKSIKLTAGVTSEAEEEDNNDDLQELSLEDLADSEDSDNDVDVDIDVNVGVPVQEITSAEDNSNFQINLSELKTITVNDLDDVSTDYKKLSLNKLRSIVVEKGLTSDSSKLNKQKLLKMLGAE